MLEKQPWLRFSTEMNLEWEQCLSEGLDVERYKSLCAEISKLEGFNEALAHETAALLHAAPVCGDFGFTEPSDLPGIAAERRGTGERCEVSMNAEQLADAFSGAWIGRISGCLLGKPVEWFKRDRLHPLLRETDNYPMRGYINRSAFSEEMIKRLELSEDSCWADNIGGIAPVDDDTNYTVFTMKLLEVYGRDFTPSDVLEAWLKWIPMFSTCTAERVAYRNAACGMLPPVTATYGNPYREWIGAQIRGDFFGYINLGNPRAAAEMAWRDASISHTKNGIYGEMFIAAVIAAAVCGDIDKMLEAGLGEIPHNCRLTRDIRKVMDWHKSGLSAEEIIERIHGCYDEFSAHGWCHTNSNAMVVTMALLCGGGDLGRSICLAVQAAFDTDCNGATVGSIIGLMRGAGNIDRYWPEAFSYKLKTTIEGYSLVAVDELAAKTAELYNKQAGKD